MTGFATASSSTAITEIAIEARAVNSRYLEVSLKLPAQLSTIEFQLRELIGLKINRGKIDCAVHLKSKVAPLKRLDIDKEQLRAVIAACDIINQEVPCVEYDALKLLNFPGVLKEGYSDDVKQLSSNVLKTFETCIDTLIQSRIREGEKLAALIIEKIEKADKTRSNILRALKTAQKNQKATIIRKIEDLNLEVNTGGMEKELVSLLLKSDIAEELDRLAAHTEEVRQILSIGKPCGRKLDFLMQELNREANTIASKALNADITFNALELKVLIEQMREQVQNIE